METLRMTWLFFQDQILGMKWLNALIGNALNLALNLLGCYVHDLRLQCLEFFNRFYKEGGKPYKPLAIQTKYVDVIKEEQ